MTCTKLLIDRVYLGCTKDCGRQWTKKHWVYWWWRRKNRNLGKRSQKFWSQVIGIGLFSKKDLKRIKAWRGRCRGTSWPAPATVTNVSPLYTWLHPPTYKLQYNAPQINICLNTMHRYSHEKVPIFTLPWSYHGYQFVMVASFSASTEYRVAVTGTTASVSPLHIMYRDWSSILHLLLRLCIHLHWSHL